MPGDLPTIVVVEDDASMSRAIERILRAGGFVAATFASAEAVLEEDAATTASCLILDSHLPGMSGVELYRRLTLGGACPPAIFITGHDEPGVREEAERMGASAYFTKPFSGRELLDAVLKASGAA